jgi:mitogen-activated protein kinase 1/3
MLSCSSTPSGEQYQITHSLGDGAYGIVVAALHKPSNRQVAIKRVLPFEHSLFCLRTLRELKLLKYFSEACVNENVSLTMLLIVTLSYALHRTDYLHFGHRKTHVNG